MNTVTVSFDTFTNIDHVDFTVTIDDEIVWQGTVTSNPQTIKIEIDDDIEKQHELCFCLSGKTSNDTTLDAQGEIISDKLLFVENISFDGIELDQMFYNLARYDHDYNGTKSAVSDQFFGAMGCNGTVSMSFSSPVYTWLLENM